MHDGISPFSGLQSITSKRQMNNVAVGNETGMYNRPNRKPSRPWKGCDHLRQRAGHGLAGGKMRILLTAVLMVAPAVASTCEDLKTAKLAGARIESAGTVAAGAFTPPQGGVPGSAPTNYKALPAFCRVQGVLEPSSDSHIQFEVWLPAAGWNGKYEGLGNGGFAGAIDYAGLGDAVAHGYAVSDSDTGHEASVIDARWALGHPEKIADFGYRAVHETAEKAKALIAAFYGSQARRSYFSSCSDGGREALMEAQRYPADYDGILAGAPANNWTKLLANAAEETKMLSDAQKSIPTSKLPAIEAAALAACDANDGVKDGIINDPSRCKFDPAVLLCKGAESEGCLTAPQLASLQRLYTGAQDSSGKTIFPGRLPGAEATPGGWGLWITGQAPGTSLMYSFATQYFANMAFADAAWDYHTFQLGRDLKVAEEKTARMLNATDPELSRFRDRGGKLIVYHGWNDPAISALNSVNYFRSVQGKMGAGQTNAFFRLYLAPGVTHCGGGPGPDVFGQTVGQSGDPEQSLSKALERWVETGTQPDRIVATKYAMGPNPTVVRTRPLCPYPQVASYKGSGSTDDAANFACMEPK
jgi:feruloyl esterase